MQKVTFFTTKGGAGRTTSTMALASGFLFLGKRVLVMDCTDEAAPKLHSNPPTTLQRWRKAMSACHIHNDRLQLTECWTAEQVEDTLASAESNGFDIALIDTRADPLAPQDKAIQRSDLILSPAIGQNEARDAARGINEHLFEPDNVLGLISGCRAGVDYLPAIRAAFGDLPLLKTELPWSDAIGEQMVHGDLNHFTASLACKQGQSGYARFRDTQTAWSAVLKLTNEVQWALDGMRLEAHDPTVQFTPLSLQVCA